MKKFALKLILISLPIGILLGLFFITDPFRIIFRYKDYSENMFVIPNRDFVSSEMYLRNTRTYHYNSFIFGSSRTIAYKTVAWKKHLPLSARPFVFDASGESIYGIYKKIKYLDRTGAHLENCLLIFCTDCTFAKETDHTEHLGIKHPTIAGTSWVNFYAVFIKDYFDNRFLKNYIQYLVTKKYTPSMKGYIEFRKSKFDQITNDEWLIDQEKELAEDSIGYYEKRKDLFYERDSFIADFKPQISKKQQTMLHEMEAIFRKHHTNFKIVISPLYSQIKMNQADVDILQNTFGQEHVYNFSGKNCFTAKKENYYENSHYRPFIGDSILNIIYPYK